MTKITRNILKSALTTILSYVKDVGSIRSLFTQTPELSIQEISPNDATTRILLNVRSTMTILSNKRPYPILHKLFPNAFKIHETKVLKSQTREAMQN